MTSCGPSLRYYTKNIHDDFQWTTESLSKIQFYLSDDIILRRNLTSGESYVENGKIKTIEGHKVEEIIIRSGTKGVYVFSPKTEQYAISFDPKDDTKYLVFGPSPKVNERYVLLAKDWNRTNGSVTYGGQVYKTPQASAFAYLMVDYDMDQNRSSQRTVERGRNVGGK